MFLEPDIYLFWSNRNNITSSHFVLSNCYITVIYLIYFRCICYSNIYSLFVYSRDVNNTFTNLIIFWIISMSYYDWAWNIVKFFYTNILLLIFYTQLKISLLIYIYILYVQQRLLYFVINLYYVHYHRYNNEKQGEDRYKNIRFVLCFYFSIILRWKLEFYIYQFLLFVLHYIKCLLLFLIKLLITDAL